MTDIKELIRGITDPRHRGRSSKVDQHEIVEGLIAHYVLITESDAAHGSRSDWVEVTSIQVNDEHCKPDDFPAAFLSWVDQEVCEYEGIRP